jgi:multidrug resistance efflux pump
MAIKKTIEFTVETKKAQVNLKELGNTIQEQKDITIQFERELSDLEAQLESTSSANIGKQKALRTRVTDLKSALKDQRLTLKELNNEKTKANKITDISTKTLSQNYGVVQLLDQVTGGLASQVRSVVDANKLFNISLKGTRKALIATGIGAFVVALGAVVAYWDEISDFI